MQKILLEELRTRALFYFSQMPEISQGNQLDDSIKVNAKIASTSQSTGKGAVYYESDGSC